MDIKDIFVKLYIKQYVIPRALIFDKSGFLDFKISGKTNVFARQILMPESMFVEFETNLIKKFQEDGKKTLYSIGKKFGYSFAQLGRFENIKDHPGEGIKDWIIVATKFVEGTYASNISQSIYSNTKSVDFILTNFVVCEKLGFDYFLASSGAAGILAWIFQDSTIEGYMYDSKFESNNQISKVFCAPLNVLNEKFKGEIYSETDLKDLDHDISHYNQFNAEINIPNSKSFQDYLDSKIFEYNSGRITYNGERFFLVETTALYLLELELKENMKLLLKDAAFNIGKNIFSKFGGGNSQAVSEILGALGWGKVTVTGTKTSPQVIIEHFPWTKYYDLVNFLIISNILSGALSEIYGLNIIFAPPIKDMSNGYLNLVFKAKL